MTAGAELPRAKAYLVQILVLIAINVPAVSFGLAMGWVSLATGESGSDGADGSDGSDGAHGAALVGAAAATFAAGLAGLPLAARALRSGRRPALVATSAAFAVSWALTLAGGWCVVAGRVVGGAAGAAAWLLAPLLAGEMVQARVRGAGAAAVVLAHNLGVLVMYLAAELRLPRRTAEWWCLALAGAHCAACLLLPESPAFLAAAGRHQEARAALARLRGAGAEHPALAAELRALPPPAAPGRGSLALFRDMLSARGRRRAFVVALVAVVGQEACGALSLVQFAERVFVLARAGAGAGAGAGGASPARLALLLGAVQLVASGAALYLVERVGRRRLLVAGAVAAGAGAAVAAGAVAAGAGAGAVAGALAAALAADSLALQPAPYALLADMFTHEYRETAMLAVTAAACAANAAETVVFAAAARGAGLACALALAAAATLALALYAALRVPESRGRSPRQIYALLAPERDKQDAERAPAPSPAASGGDGTSEPPGDATTISFEFVLDGSAKRDGAADSSRCAKAACPDSGDPRSEATETRSRSDSTSNGISADERYGGGEPAGDASSLGLDVSSAAAEQNVTSEAQPEPSVPAAAGSSRGGGPAAPDPRDPRGEVTSVAGGDVTGASALSSHASRTELCSQETCSTDL